MLARQPADREQPLLDQIELARVEGNRFQGLRYARLRRAQFSQCPVERGQCRIEPSFHATGRPLEPPQRVQHLALCAIGAQGLRGTIHILADAHGGLHEPAARVERGLLSRLRRQRVQLAHGVAQERFLGPRGLERFRLARRIALCRGEGRPRRSGRGKLLLQPGKGVEQRPVAARIEKSAIVVLAVQLHQRLRQPPQHLTAHPPVVDPGSLAAIRGVDAAQDQTVIVRQPRFAQNRMGGMAGGEIEDSRHLALRRPRPHQRRAATPAQHKTQGVQQDRLAGAGLAGQHVETRPEVKLQPVDDEQIADIETAQHGSVPSRAPRLQPAPRRQQREDGAALRIAAPNGAARGPTPGKRDSARSGGREHPVPGQRTSPG